MTDPARPRCRRPLDRISGGDGVEADIFRQPFAERSIKMYVGPELNPGGDE